VAAVAATVAGVVALGIGATSDELENQRRYTPTLADGDGAVSTWGGEQMDWTRIEQAIGKALPANAVTSVEGLPEGFGPGDGGESAMLRFGAPGGPDVVLSGVSTSLGSSVLVGRDSVPGGLLDLDAHQRAAVRQVLLGGGAVVVTSEPVRADEVRISAELWSEDGQTSRKAPPATVPAVYVEVPGEMAPLQAVLSPQVTKRLGLKPTTTGVYVDGPISKSAEADITEVVGAMSQDASFYVERGYQADDRTTIALIVLAALGGILMLGGTLTATFLALSDARPDLATLSAVGAAARTRRGVAAAYAGTVGLVGATLGAVVGFVPGIAVTYPLTSTVYLGRGLDAQGRPFPAHFLDIPWVLIATVVVLLPLLTALVVGLTCRSRLPLVARIE
jgi:putative ABC transport system permease protein